MTGSSAMAADNRVGARGRVAMAVASSVDQIPSVGRSKVLTFATIYPGGVVKGVVLSAQAVAVHLLVDRSRYGDDLRIIGDEARGAAQDALHAFGDPRPVEVHIDDLVDLEDAGGVD
jgi:hypothetical protein